MSECRGYTSLCVCRSDEHDLTVPHRCECGGEWIDVPEELGAIIPVTIPGGIPVPLDVVATGIRLSPTLRALFELGAESE